MERFVCNLCNMECSTSDNNLNEVFSYVENKLVEMCTECVNFNDKVIWCEYHNRLELTSGDFELVQSLGYVCREAIETSGEYSYCESCGKLYRTDSLAYDEDDDDECDGLLCNRCLSSRAKIIKSYHDSHNNMRKFFYADNESKDDDDVLEFGFELEVENDGDSSNNIVAKKVRKALPKWFVNFEHDGSLDDGFEMISEVTTIEYMYSIEDELRYALDILTENYFKSHDTRTCGLHIHINKAKLGENNAVRNRLIILTEYFKDEMIKFSRRKHEQIDEWSRFYTRMNKDNFDIEDCKSSITDYDNDTKYMVWNRQNSETLECRAFKGTLKFETLMATFELIQNMVYFAKNNKITTESLKDLRFEQVATCKYDKYVSKYLVERGLLEEIYA